MATKTVKEAVDTALEKAEPVVRKAKAAAKTAAKKAEPAVEAVKEKAEPVLEAAKAAGKQVTAALVPEIYVQHASRQYDAMELVERCKEDFKAKHPKTHVKSCRIYVKPEDNMVYYVINDLEDKLAL